MARAGAFRERAAFERRDVSDGFDRYGNPTPAAWSPLVTLRADLRETPGREAIAAGRTEATTTATLRLRAGAVSRQISAEDRVTIRGKTWSIVSDAVWADGVGRVLEFRLEHGGAAR